MNKMILMRGISGSGKSTLAKEIAKKNPSNTVILCTDDAVCDSNGVYLWSPDYIGLSHKLNQAKAKEACRRGYSTVIIDNTNLTRWERKPYEDIAKKFQYEVEIVEPTTKWKDDPIICAAKSKHLSDAEITTRQLAKKE